MSDSQGIYRYRQIQDQLGHGKTPAQAAPTKSVDLAHQLIQRRIDPSQVNPLARPVEAPKVNQSVNQILGAIR